MSFGVPGRHGKFYAGRSDDTPVNHVRITSGCLAMAWVELVLLP